MCEFANALTLTVAEAAAGYDVIREQPPPEEPRAPGRFAEMAEYVRNYKCRPSVQEDYARARGFLQEALVVIRGMDLNGCDTGYLFPQLHRKVKDVLAELDSFARFVLVVNQGGPPKGGRPRKATLTGPPAVPAGRGFLLAS